MNASTSRLPQRDTARGDAPGSRMAAPLGLLFSVSWTVLVSALKGRQAMSPGQRPGRRTAHVHGQPFDVARDMPVERSVSRLSSVPEGEGKARVLSSSNARAA
jgi:hypothetical protein